MVEKRILLPNITDMVGRIETLTFSSKFDFLLNLRLLKDDFSTLESIRNYPDCLFLHAFEILHCLARLLDKLDQLITDVNK
jgi:hypothetical protein